MSEPAEFTDNFNRSSPMGAAWLSPRADGQLPRVFGTVSMVSVLCPQCKAEVGMVGVGGGCEILECTGTCPDCGHTFRWRSAQ